MNETTEMLGFADRIKKPIPLAALAILVVAVVSLALIQAGVAQVGALGFVITGVVAVIALVALIGALIATKPGRATIMTGGNYSPGEVGGDYSVGKGSPLPRKWGSRVSASVHRASANVDNGRHKPDESGG